MNCAKRKSFFNVEYQQGVFIFYSNNDNENLIENKIRKKCFRQKLHFALNFYSVKLKYASENIDFLIYRYYNFKKKE